MAERQEDFYEPYLESRIGEMGGLDTATSGLPVPSDFLEQVKANDDDPMFVTVEVETDGLSFSGSGRRWKPEHVRQVVSKVNKERMAGNLGHPLLDSKSYERDFPAPQVVWVAAKHEEKGGKTVGTFKGYVLKTAQAREYLKLGLIDGVSWFGNTAMKAVKGGYDVIRFDPETLDFARKGRAGMQSRVLALAGEQASEGGSVDAKEIAALSEDELRSHAPLLVREIERQAVEPIEVKVGEQATLVETLTPEAEISKKVRELLGLQEGENPIEKLTKLLETIEESSKSEIKAYIKEKIASKVKTPRAQAVLDRLIGEMHTDYEGELTAELKNQIDADFDAKIEEDDMVKGLVGEMAGWKDQDKGGSGGSNLGGRSRLGENRGREDFTEDSAVVRKTGNVTVRKRKLLA